jgi:hypothetical protein
MSQEMETKLKLHLLPETIVITSSSLSLEISRKKHTLKQFERKNDHNGEEIYGLIGIARFFSDPYLVVISSREYVGCLKGHHIWKIVKSSLIPFSEIEISEEERWFVSRFQSCLDLPTYYFSPSFDITKGSSFFFNKRISKPLKNGFSAWITPIILGFIQIEKFNLDQHSFSFALISRRSTKRAGTKLNVRGIDEDGYTANFVETEQIVEGPNTFFSFIQVRGSIPLFWEQPASLHPRPKPQLIRMEENELAFRKHISNLRKYGKITIVNLANYHGREKKLSAELEKQVDLLDSPLVKYSHVDFAKPDFHLLLRNKTNLYSEKGSKQKHIFRVNCLDCLDRTNVFQYHLGLEILKQQFKKIGFKIDLPLETLIREIWVNNGDKISLQYAGTPALKRYFIRKGNRDFEGFLDDGLFSVWRYITNNFFDGQKQDSFKVFLSFDPNEVPRKKKDYVKLILIIGTILFLVVSFLIRKEGVLSRLTVILIWVISLMVVLKLYGRRLVNQPRLFSK